MQHELEEQVHVPTTPRNLVQKDPLVLSVHVFGLSVVRFYERVPCFELSRPCNLTSPILTRSADEPFSNMPCTNEPATPARVLGWCYPVLVEVARRGRGCFEGQQLRIQAFIPITN